MAINTENSTHVNRLHDIASAIEGARKAIQSWEDKRTEAMIDLDALAYDIRLLEDEKKQALEVADQYRLQLKNQEKLYRAQNEAFSDQLQEAKLEIEHLKELLREAQVEITLGKNELQNQIQIMKEYEAKQPSVIANARAELEIALSDLRHQFKQKVEEMTEQLQSTFHQKSEAQVKANQLEQELQMIRTQMISALNGTEVKVKKIETKKSETPMIAMPIENRAEQTASFKQPELLEDYLKRLGY